MMGNSFGRFKSLKRLLLLALVAGIAIACQLSNPENSDIAGPVDSAENSSAQPSSAPASENSLSTPTASATYQDPDIPIAAQYPEQLQAEGRLTDEGANLEFTFPEAIAASAKMTFTLPATAVTSIDLERTATEPDGLLAQNNWQVLEDSALVKRLNYPWIRTVIAFSGEGDLSGAVILGETNGQTVQLVVQYPDAAAQTYWATAMLILDNLEFDAEQLPLVQQ